MEACHSDSEGRHGIYPICKIFKALAVLQRVPGLDSKGWWKAGLQLQAELEEGILVRSLTKMVPCAPYGRLC